MNKYEQLIEHIINDNADAARELFHNIVVEKSRDIYESLIDEQDLEEVGGNPVQDLAHDVQMDEQGISEEEDEEFGGEEGNDFDNDGELDDHEEDHGEIEDRVMDLEDALDELKAEFDALMAGEEQEPEHADMFGGEEEAGEEAPEEFYESEEEEEEELDESACEDEEEEEVEESIVREYVEKVGETGQKSEGGEVGKAGSANINKQSTVAGKNDMGGSSANIAKGGSNTAPDGTSANKGEANQYKKGQTQVKNAGKFENVPGARAGQAFAKKETSWEKNKGAEGKTTAGSAGGVNAKSPLAKK